MEKFYLDESEYPDGVPSITSMYQGEFPSVVDRYFKKYYFKPKPDGCENEDHLVLFHSNRVCLIGLAKSHVAFSKGISSINYNIGNCDRSLNVVKGKHKKGGMNLTQLTTLAMITCDDGSQYKIVSCVQGKLIEVNHQLEGDLERLKKEGEGYIGIVLCKPEHCEKVKNALIAESEYSPS